MKNLPANSFERQITRSNGHKNTNYTDHINMHDSDIDKSEDMKLYLHIVKQRKWRIILSSFIFFSLAVVAALSEKTLYESKSRILIEKVIPKILDVQELQQIDP